MTAPAVVLFDLDDTLFAHRDAVDEGIVRHLCTVGGAFASVDAAEAITLWNGLEEEHYHAYLAGMLDFQGQRRARARDFAAAHGLSLSEEEADAWFDAYFVHYESNWRLHDDTFPCLLDLESAIPGVRFGLITNAGLAYQLRKLDFTGLTKRIEHVVASGSLGFTKPDPRIFLHACDVFGARPPDVVYVGDRLRTDAIGAATAGLTGVWIDRRAASVTEADAAEADRLGVLRITGLAELPAALAGR